MRVDRTRPGRVRMDRHAEQIEWRRRGARAASAGRRRTDHAGPNVMPSLRSSTRGRNCNLRASRSTPCRPSSEPSQRTVHGSSGQILRTGLGCHFGRQRRAGRQYSAEDEEARPLVCAACYLGRLVGRPSAKKSPIIKAAWEPLHHAQKIDLDYWRQQLADWKALPKNERDPEEPKPKRRFVSHDGTMEALQDILGRQDRGIGVLRDELSGWIGSLEKYLGAKASGADRAFFLQAFDGGPNVIDRVSRGTIAVNNLLVTICGGIQPDRLRQFSDLTDDGLWQRFVTIIVAPASRGLDERPGLAVADYMDAINRILTVPGATRAELSEAAHGVRADIERQVFDLEQSDVLGARFASFCGKLAGLWGRLCLVLNYLDPADTHFIVPLKTAERAASLLFQSVIPCAARVYAATGGAGADAEATRSVAGYILTKQKDRVLASDLAHNVRACRGQPLDNVQRVVSPLWPVDG